ncbi:MAG: tRNA dimethylallyltransferase [Myxococcota bacterium]|jgi:tRNA dimethylallyltransferase
MSSPTTENTSPQPVVVLTGPTAAGKSSLALELARRFEGEIVNADSMQVFKYMDIGTAKPSLEERATVPHHMFDVATPEQEYSAGRYATEARAAAARVHASGKLVLLVGGTGLYIRAFLEGLIDTGGADTAFRERLELEHTRAVESGKPLVLYRRLESLDPKAAAAIHPNDLRRIIRALEIVQRSGREASTVRSEHGFKKSPYKSLHLALDPGRDIVNERINERCEKMIERGLLQEVRRLREMGYGPELRPMQAIGYRHINPVADGTDTLANALTSMQGDTRRFARRQRTWIRKVEEARWCDPRDGGAVHDAVEAFLKQL